MIDREEIIKLLSLHEWIKLLDIFRDNEQYALIQEDNILVSMIETLFISELLSDTNTNDIIHIKFLLEQFYSLHRSSRYNFVLTDRELKKLLLRLMCLEKKLDVAYKYALLYPNELGSIKIIKEYNETKPNIKSHSLEDKLYVTQNKNIKSFDARMSLFKSQQEFYFYQAMIECYPMHHVFPNVSLNAIIDFEAIKEELSEDEKHFFWKALIDCVLINPADNYKAIAFYELDSYFHDNEIQRKRDSMKDSILAKSGQILERIRPKEKINSKDDFVLYIRDSNVK